MNNFKARKKPSSLSPDEKRSIEVLMDKMNLSRKEVIEVSTKYGVSASRLIELMQLSKYEFVNTHRSTAQCAPCRTSLGRIDVRRYF